MARSASSPRAFSPTSLLRRLFRSPARPAPKKARRVRLAVESLEERVVLTGPTAVADTAWTFVGQAVKVSVLANDTAPAGATLSVSSATQGQHGAVAVNSDGTVTYTPAAGFTGADTFSYTASDGQGHTASAGVSLTVYAAVAPSWPVHVGAPYVDATLFDFSAGTTYQFATAGVPAGLKYYTLGFVQSAAQDANQPAWGGFTAYEVSGSGTFQTQMTNQIAAIRAAGGDVAVSFGGAAGTELAESHTTVASLKAQYASVINAYQLTRLDFDVETSTALDPSVVDRRNQALASLQQDAAAAGKELDVWFTLPVEPTTGLGSSAYYVLQSALRYGVKIDGVNVLAMDYGDSNAPNPQGQMGTFAVEAAQTTFGQLQTLYGSARTDAQLWRMVGITPMVGQNDTPDEVLLLPDAQQVLTFAEQHGVGRLSLWTLDRDHHTDGTNDVPNDMMVYADSGIHESPLQFSILFNQFTGSAPGQAPPTAGDDSATVAQGDTVLIDVLANDQPGAGASGPLTITAFTQGGHGSVTRGGTGELQYTPSPSFHGSDSFTYTVQESNGETATATVRVTVNAAPPPNQDPVAVNDAATTTAGQPVVINVLANDSDPDGDRISVTPVTQPKHGGVATSGTLVEYTPAVGFVGTDSFTYVISDGRGGTAGATVTVTVNPTSVPAPPVYGPPPIPHGIQYRLVHSHGRFELVLTDAVTGVVVRRLVLPRWIQSLPAVQRMDVNGDGIADVVLRFRQGAIKRHLTLSGLDGSPLSM